MPDALPDTTLPISRLGTGSTNGSNNGRGWGFIHIPSTTYHVHGAILFNQQFIKLLFTLIILTVNYNADK
jgi:hypothetical protein